MSQKPDYQTQKFVTRARTVLWARLAFLAIGFLILVIPKWSLRFGTEDSFAILWFGFVVVYCVFNFFVLRYSWGRLFTFITLTFDLICLIYLISSSGGLKSPALLAQCVYTVLFALLFTKPLAILPPLLTLPIVAKISQLVYGLADEDLFILLWYSTINFVLVWVILYLNIRENQQQKEILELQRERKQTAVLEERNRLAREIHDGLGASLSALLIQSEYLMKLSKDKSLLSEIEELRRVAEESIDELRRSITMMRDDFALVAALEDYCSVHQARSGVMTSFSVSGTEIRVDPELSLAIFRILQESLTNISKHAQAQKTDVMLTFGANALEMIIKDNGQGFEVEQTFKDHYGLINMRERARKVGGELQIESVQGEGTRIEIRLPATIRQEKTVF